MTSHPQFTGVTFTYEDVLYYQQAGHAVGRQSGWFECHEATITVLKAVVADFVSRNVFTEMDASKLVKAVEKTLPQHPPPEGKLEEEEE